MRGTELVPPVALTHRNHRELGEYDGSSNSRSHFFGAFHTETDMTRVVSHSNKGLEASTLSSTGLFLHWHDLEDLVFERAANEEVYYLGLFDRNGEEVDILQTLDFAIFYKTAKFSDRNPL